MLTPALSEIIARVLHTYRNDINGAPFHQNLGLVPNVSEALIDLAYDCPLQFVTLFFFMTILFSYRE
jgi:hypothetical protein